MSSIKDYQNWKVKDGAIGCKFARMIAMQPSRYDQEVTTTSASHSPKVIATRIDSIVKAAVAGSAEASAILLPMLTDFSVFSRALISLGDFEGWTVSISDLPEHDCWAVAIKLEIVRSDGVLTDSEVLVFADQPHMPATRRAPVFSLELFTGDPSRFDPKTGAPTAKANLAHLNMDILDDTAYEDTWQKTREARLSSLGNVDDTRAKAKVSYVVPKGIALSCGIEDET